MARKFFVGGNFKMYVSRHYPAMTPQNPALKLQDSC